MVTQETVFTLVDVADLTYYEKSTLAGTQNTIH